MDRKEYYRNNADRLKEYYRNNADRLKELSRLNYEKKKNNPEYKEWMRTYYREHKEQIKEKAHKRYQEHAEERREKARAYYWEHKEQIGYKDRYHNNPADRGRHLFDTYKYFDREKNLAPVDPSDYPTQDEINEMMLQPCVWCGERDWHKIGFDRKDNRFGHVRDNIQPCCKRCNTKKGKRSNEEFRQAIAEGRIKLKADADTTAIPDL